MPVATRSVFMCLLLLPACGGDDGAGSGSDDAADTSSSTESDDTGAETTGDETETEADAEAEATGDETTETDADGTEETGPPPVECPAPFDWSERATELPPPYGDCGLPEPCETVLVEIDFGNPGGGPPTLQNPAAFACVLEALDAGTSAQHRIDILADLSSETVRVFVYADGRVELMREGSFDLMYDAHQSPHQLDEAHDFAACGAEVDWAGQEACVLQGLLDCAAWLEATDLCG